MSFTPTLVIKKKDLEKNRAKIEMSEYKTHRKENISKAWAELRIILNKGSIDFEELSIVIAQPEFTYLNENVRNLLTKLNIDYKLEC